MKKNIPLTYKSLEMALRKFPKSPTIPANYFILSGWGRKLLGKKTKKGKK